MRLPRSVHWRRSLAAAIVATAFVAGMLAAPAVVTPVSGQSLPTPWTSTDIGAVGLAGSADFADGVFTVKGAGADIWGSADSFHFVSQPLSGDTEIVARVVSVENTHTYAKAGVMLRGALTANAAHVILDVKPGGGIEFMKRNSSGGSTTYLAGASAAAPVWLRLIRSGSTVIGSWSADGSAWAEVGRTTISLPSTVYAGLPVTSHNASVLNTSTFDHVSVAAGPVNQPPTVAITSPSNAQTFDAPASISIAASAGDVDGTISSVEFFANGASIGTDTTSPYGLTWNQSTPGSYTLTALATDSGGAQTQSAGVAITVRNPTTPSTTLRRLRVMTWNVNAGRTRDGVAAVDAQVSLMARSRAHVIVLHEVTIEPGADLPTMYETQLEAATGQPWNAVWAEEPRPAPAIPQGNLVLSRLPLGGVEIILLDGAPQDASALDAKRSAARVSFVVNDVPVTLAATMLASDAASRQVQIDQLQSWMSTVAQPRLLGGSLNMRPTDPGYADLASTFADVWPALVTTPDSGTTTEVFGSPAAPARVDGWWQEITGGRALATEVWIVKSARSDHHAVVAEVEVR